MSAYNLNTRIDALERLHKRDRMRILCKLPDGKEIVCGAPEMLEKGGRFCKLISGSDLIDFDLILSQFKSKAEADCMGDEE
jgi:hypothetical protein